MPEIGVKPEIMQWDRNVDSRVVLLALGGRIRRKERWPCSFGQFSEIFKWNVRGDHAADLIAGSVAKYASSGIRSA
ncbi:MAG: unnamed protein product, partial [uncultured Paraburkholderia sp.]